MHLIIDLEATCWQRDEGHRGENEIIEIGAVLVDDAAHILHEIQYFVRPVRNPILSDFCRQLTSIQQTDVDSANAFPDAMAAFQTEVEEHSGRPLAELIFCSWGDYDRKQFHADCAYHRIAYPFGAHWNVKQEFARRHRIKPRGIDAALRFLGLRLEGTHHRGIDDARNIARIFQQCGGMARQL